MPTPLTDEIRAFIGRRSDNITAGDAVGLERGIRNEADLELTPSSDTAYHDGSPIPGTAP